MEAPVKSPTAVLPLSRLDDAQLKIELARYRIGLTVEEARKISAFLGRDPTLVEATIWGVQGSEHCSYKSSRRFLKTLPTTGKRVILGPGEDSGIVAITDGPPGKRWGIVISHESHNHPSQIVPFEGAATGIGGTVRDVACMGARVIGCMDMLRLGDLRTAESRSIAKEVARGIAGYGNPLGIPNLGGDTYFDAGFNANCLVNAVAIGLVREDEIIHSVAPDEAGRIGYDIIVVGKPTDRSGFGGASFASRASDEDKREQNSGAVQEPNPFLERHLLVSTYALFDWLAATENLRRVSFKDLGAGGVVCASVEQVAGAGLGARVDLDAVHVALEDLPPEVIACAETQERFCWICHPDLTQHILAHYNDVWDLPGVAEGAKASRIGTVTTDGMYRLTHRGLTVCDAKAVDITSGLQYVRPTAQPDTAHTEPTIRCAGDAIELVEPARLRTTTGEVFRRMLLDPNSASKDPFIRHFDKTVIGLSHTEAGEADASVIAPLKDLRSFTLGGEHPGWAVTEADRETRVAFAADGNPRYGKISAYAQGLNAAVESMCNVAAVGALPVAVTDCLNYGNAETPEHLGALEQGVRGIADACNGVRIRGEPVPVISGNVSLYNSTPDGRSIPPSAIVCCIGVAPSPRTVTMRLQEVGSTLILLGKPADECGGSAYYASLEAMAGLPTDALLGSCVPQPSPDDVCRRIEFLASAIADGTVLSCHDVSDGGLALALFEMTLPQRKVGGRIGIDADLSALESEHRNDVLLFSQSQGFILEVHSSAAEALLSSARDHGIDATIIGRTTGSPRLAVRHGEQPLIGCSLAEARDWWSRGLRDALR